ncbi:PE/PPE C-terminal domain-containing protein, partial [Mycobacterium tuberculosis]|nr:PE/PPE C-terminal domain-containing protein [Mycobacterium tuberculosis]
VAAADAAGDVLGEATSGGLGGALVAPLGSAGGLGGTVAAGLGNAATVGTLSVPPSWTAAAPLASPLGSALGGTPMVAPPPAVAAGMPGMPFGTMGGQGFGRAVPQYGFRPNFVARPPAAG